MKPRVILRPQVPTDLESILDFFAERNPAIADRFADILAATLEDLAAMPGKGSPKNFRHRQLADIRSWTVPGFRNYLILYRPVDVGIDVLAITHGARQLAKLLKGRT